MTFKTTLLSSRYKPDQKYQFEPTVDKWGSLTEIDSGSRLTSPSVGPKFELKMKKFINSISDFFDMIGYSSSTEMCYKTIIKRLSSGAAHLPLAPCLHGR